MIHTHSQEEEEKKINESYLKIDNIAKNRENDCVLDLEAVI